MRRSPIAVSLLWLFAICRSSLEFARVLPSSLEFSQVRCLWLLLVALLRRRLRPRLPLRRCPSQACVSAAANLRICKHTLRASERTEMTRINARTLALSLQTLVRRNNLLLLLSCRRRALASLPADSRPPLSLSVCGSVYLAQARARADYTGPPSEYAWRRAAVI